MFCKSKVVLSDEVWRIGTSSSIASANCEGRTLSLGFAALYVVNAVVKLSL